MRRLIWIIGIVGAVCAAPAQVWEKLITEGMTYRMEVDKSTPRVIHGLRLSLGSKVTSKPEVGNLALFATDLYGSKQTISQLVRQTGAIAGINADFFGKTNSPIGFMSQDGQLVSGPYKNRSVWGWNHTVAESGFVTFKCTVKGAFSEAFEVDVVNRETIGGEIILYTSKAAATKAKLPCTQLLLKIAIGNLTPSQAAIVDVERVVRDQAEIAVPEGYVVLCAGGTKQSVLDAFKVGDRLTINFEAKGFDWTKITNAVGGGPQLVRNKRPKVDWDRQGFTAEFARKRHPRTAIGKTASGELWLVAIDGRQAMSDGATLDEAAAIMIRLGCVEAINLDGGGSTTFNLLGLTLNRPSDGTERPVANGIVVFGEPVIRNYTEPKVVGPDKLVVGKPMTFKVFDKNGVMVPNVAVIWAATGSAWIDQGGMVYPQKAGTVTVSAWIGGKVYTTNVIVNPG
ncbi:MAG: phosphodiester glycosidase family protein [Fimbriimonadaceae bacterium]|nr:phosphodiester glycosidase family protein [Fimbriimonadaceae bacterium]